MTQILKRCLAGACVLAVIGVLSGCGGGNQSVSSVKSDPPVSSATSETGGTSSDPTSPPTEMVIGRLIDAGYFFGWPKDLDEKSEDRNEPYTNDKISERMTMEERTPEEVKTGKYSFDQDYIYINARYGYNASGAEEFVGMIFLQVVSRKAWDDSSVKLNISGKEYGRPELEKYVVSSGTFAVVLNVTELAYGMPYEQYMKEKYLPEHAVEGIDYSWLFELNDYLTQCLPDMLVSK